jgi:hypothetical protein
MDQYIKINKKEIMHKKYDYIIIGSGLTGSYLAYQLSIKYPNRNILIIEQNKYSGGRIESNYKKNIKQNPLQIAYEFGAMRFFPDIHPRIMSLIKKLNLETIEVPYKISTNIFCGRNKVFLNNSLFPSTNICYNVNNNEKNKNTFDYVNKIILNIFKKYGINYISEINLYEIRKKLYSNKKICNLNFKQELLNINNKYYISNENYNRFQDITGYSNVLNTNISFLAASYDISSINNYSKQLFIKKGTHTIINNLLNKYKLFNKFSLSNNLILYNNEFIKFENNGNENICYIKNNNTKKIIKLYCKKLFITIPINKINNIMGFKPDFYNNYFNNLVELPLFKMFFYYKKNWWSKYGFKNGKCTTDLPLNQLWFYNNNTLMSYSSGDDAKYWLSLLPYEKQINFIKINNNNKLIDLVKIYLNFIKIMFKDYINTIPFPDKISWIFYMNGQNIWNVNLDKNRNINDIKNKLIYGEKKEHVYYLNNDISLNQGWMEGCLEIVDNFLLDNRNI